MPRIGRLVVPNYPYHIVHRGHNRAPVFASEDDYHYYLDNLLQLKNDLGCKLYAYCLMTNHVHLIVDPGDNTEALSVLMKKVAARQTRYVNRLARRTGTLWEGRFRSSIVCKDSYLLACCRYVEMNPVRAAMVEHPSMYQWSSFNAKTSAVPSPSVDYDPLYLAMGTDDETRRAGYERWIMSSVPEEEWERICQAVQRSHPVGSVHFKEAIAEKLGIRLEHRPPGRPRKINQR